MTNFKLKQQWAGFPAETVKSEEEWKYIIGKAILNMFTENIILDIHIFEPVPEKKWPQVGDEYFFIGNFGDILQTRFYNNMTSETSMLFKSRYHAEEVLKMIKEKREELGYES